MPSAFRAAGSTSTSFAPPAAPAPPPLSSNSTSTSLEPTWRFSTGTKAHAATGGAKRAGEWTGSVKGSAVRMGEGENRPTLSSSSGGGAPAPAPVASNHRFTATGCLTPRPFTPPSRTRSPLAPTGLATNAPSASTSTASGAGKVVTSAHFSAKIAPTGTPSAATVKLVPSKRPSPSSLPSREGRGKARAAAAEGEEEVDELASSADDDADAPAPSQRHGAMGREKRRRTPPREGWGESLEVGVGTMQLDERGRQVFPAYPAEDEGMKVDQVPESENGEGEGEVLGREEAGEGGGGAGKENVRPPPVPMPLPGAARVAEWQCAAAGTPRVGGGGAAGGRGGGGRGEEVDAIALFMTALAAAIGEAFLPIS
ncbi:hypothetical protein JCM10207_008882, partial [Rhodosporidiobolus poonsookiae]